MRFVILMFAVFAGVQGGWRSVIDYLTTAPDVVRQVDALNKNDFVAYAQMFGMNLTFYDAVTPDGWVLQLWRVRSMDIYDEKLSAPVIVAHGFGSSSFDYMWNLRNQSTAFVLADNGYDVFFTNFRGNQFSNNILMNGEIRKPKPEEYFRVAWQYMAERDLPTIFDKVLNVTGQSKFYLIGHSMGTTIPFAFLSENHTYDDKLSHFAAVVPVLKFGVDTSLDLKLLLALAPPVVRALQVDVPVVKLPFVLLFDLLFGTQLLASSGSPESFIQSTVCGAVPIVCLLAVGLLVNRELFTGILTDPHLNQTRAAIYFNKTPGGVTLMNAYDYGQQLNKETWAKIDFSELPLTGFTNQGEYNSDEPPKYNFSALSVPYSLYYVKNDIFTGVDTAKEVIKELNATDYRFIDGNKLNHVDAVVAFDTRCYTTDSIMLKFQSLENDRDEDHKEYRRRVATYVDSLPFEDGCPKTEV